MGVAFADFDMTPLDLYFNRLWRQVSVPATPTKSLEHLPSFEDVTEKAGVRAGPRDSAQGQAWADDDRDGHVMVRSITLRARRH